MQNIARERTIDLLCDLLSKSASFSVNQLIVNNHQYENHLIYIDNDVYKFSRNLSFYGLMLNKTGGEFKRLSINNK